MIFIEPVAINLIDYNYTTKPHKAIYPTINSQLAYSPKSKIVKLLIS